jgi:hypothetical protein
MNTHLKTILTTTAALSALAASTVFYARAETASAPNPGSIMQGGHAEMMADMMKKMGQTGNAGQMSHMMEQCKQMMSGMMQQRSPAAQKDPKHQHKE